ncbi:MAG: aminoglycoside phosphotransferase family protein [Deltaproteobacteria bacterium]|nr:aminoglycoside phosphotransferase family protein [Deltaproteobacteria bacterium]
MSGPVPWLGNERDAWLREIGSWAATALGDRDPGEVRFETVRARAWSTVLRVSAGGQAWYLKACAPGGRHEPALAAALSADWPGGVPDPHAIDAERGWMLLPDLGATLRQRLDGADALDWWLRLLPRYGEMQRTVGRDAARWRGLGVPDRSPAALPALLEALLADDDALCAREAGGIAADERTSLEALAPEFGRICADLDDSPCPAALEHGDLHDGNVFTPRDDPVISDWGDACISHPFVTLRVTLRALDAEPGSLRFERLRDAYLEPWTRDAPATALHGIFDAALWVACVRAALNWHRMLAHGDAPSRAEWHDRIPAWLRRWRDTAPGARTWRASCVAPRAAQSEIGDWHVPPGRLSCDWLEEHVLPDFSPRLISVRKSVQRRFLGSPRWTRCPLARIRRCVPLEAHDLRGHDPRCTGLAPGRGPGTEFIS